MAKQKTKEEIVMEFVKTKDYNKFMETGNVNLIVNFLKKKYPKRWSDLSASIVPVLIMSRIGDY